MTEAQSLLRLQEIDLELIRLRKTVESHPARKRLASAEAAQRKVASQLSKIVGARKDVEIEIEDNTASRHKMETLVGECQEKSVQEDLDYKGVKALEQQLSALAKQMEKLAFQRRGLDEKLERAMTAEKNAHDLAAKIEAEKRSIALELKEDLGTVRERVQQLSGEREQITSQLSPEMLTRYDEAAKRFHGLAVEKLDGNKPSVCRVALQPSSYHDIQSGDDVTTCPYCRRILVVREI